jgi:hypothetical protein
MSPPAICVPEKEVTMTEEEKAAAAKKAADEKAVADKATADAAAKKAAAEKEAADRKAAEEAAAAKKAAKPRQVVGETSGVGYLTRDAVAEQARIVAEVEQMSALPCTPSQEELNQAMADLSQVSHVTIDDENHSRAKKAD